MTFLPHYRSGTPGRYGGIHQSVRLWAAQVVTNGGTVSDARISLMNQTVNALEAAGAWANMDDGWMLTAENAIQALTSLKQRRLAVAVNSPTFTIDRGYAFNGTSQYIDTGYIEASHAVALSLGNVRLSVYERTNNNNNTTPVGTSDNPSGAFNFILRPRGSTNFMLSQAHISTATCADTITDSRGLSVASRAGNGTTVLFFKNGIALTPVSAGLTNPATALAPRSLYIGANNNAGVAASFRASTIGWASVGAPNGSTPIELGAYNAIQAHETAIGANV
jgi:hypothetical protein